MNLLSYYLKLSHSVRAIFLFTCVSARQRHTPQTLSSDVLTDTLLCNQLCKNSALVTNSWPMNYDDMLWAVSYRYYPPTGWYTTLICGDIVKKNCCCHIIILLIRSISTISNLWFIPVYIIPQEGWWPRLIFYYTVSGLIVDVQHQVPPNTIQFWENFFVSPPVSWWPTHIISLSFYWGCTSETPTYMCDCAQGHVPTSLYNHPKPGQIGESYHIPHQSPHWLHGFCPTILLHLRDGDWHHQFHMRYQWGYSTPPIRRHLKIPRWWCHSHFDSHLPQLGTCQHLL